MPTAFSYEVLLSDYRAAVRLYRKRRRSARIWHIANRGVVCLFLGILLISYIHERMIGNSESAIQILLNFTPLLLLVAVFFPLQEWNIRRSFAALYSESQGGQMIFSFDREVFTSGVPGESESRVYWSSLQDFAEDKQVLLGWIAALLQPLVGEDSRYEIAVASAIARMDRGLPMGGGRLVQLDELHEH